MSAVLKPSAEQQLRVQLAAAYRVADHLGWSELIYTHISVRVPGPEHHFLINPYGMMFDEITASSLVKVDAAGHKLNDSPFPVNQAGFVIHSAVHAVREDVACVLHTHTRAGGTTRGRATSSCPSGSTPRRRSTRPSRRSP